MVIRVKHNDVKNVLCLKDFKKDYERKNLQPLIIDNASRLYIAKSDTLCFSQRMIMDLIKQVVMFYKANYL